MDHTTTRVVLTAIAFDAGTQIREAINEQVVADYAERMTEGVEFPPVVLFADGCCRTDGSVIYYLADGFHRVQAATRVGFVDITATVKAGTKEDALWFALGANKANGHRMTAGDKRHAILLALKTWPDRSPVEIASQVGSTGQYVRDIRHEVQTSLNLPDRVIGKDGKSYPASKRQSPATTTPPAPPSFKSREAVQQRRDTMRAMASEGYTSRQIAEAVDMSLESCRNALREASIDVPADAVIGKSRLHDSTRIVEHIVMDAENLTADVNLIDFSALDGAQIAGWLSSLNDSRDKLGAFIRRLMKEQQKHGEAA